MTSKPILHYFNSRGRMESVRWLLAAAGVEFEEKYIKTLKDLKRLKNDGNLMFQQVPMVEIDGMKLVQTRAILNYIASKYNLYGKDMKERALIDMYTEGTYDLNDMIIRYPFLPPGEKNVSLAQITRKARKCYLPAFEGISGGSALKDHGQDYLVGNRLSRADVHVVELLYHMEELNDSIVGSFPRLQALRTRVSDLPTVKKFLQPGSQRKPFKDEKYVEELKSFFYETGQDRT
ncbi:glutathione S-transferase alpha-3-like [Mastomys coucha]|uniref:glutathione S-transferase alpha-3-like n=1 Tax=Mastomys coucha TaxID=35658 RepID=UPI001262A7A1|nr:glutathione S-transferase alpha-3-like [Mastomys coucha]